MKRFPKYFKQIIAVAAVTGGLFASSPALSQVGDALVLRVPVELKQLPSKVKRVSFTCVVRASLSKVGSDLSGGGGMGVAEKLKTSNRPAIVVRDIIDIENQYGALSKTMEFIFPTQYFDLVDLHENGSYACSIDSMWGNKGNVLWSVNQDNGDILKSGELKISGKIIPDANPISSTFSGMELNQSLNENKLNRNIKLK